MRITVALTLTAALAALAACHRTAPPAPRPAPARATATATAPAPLPPGHASQLDLARAVDAADQHGTWADVVHRWQGQHLAWTVTRYRALCGSEAACHVAPFDVGKPAKYGWMPQLRFAPGAYRRLEAACAHADPCRVRIEGTLGKLVVSPELPTQLRLDDVAVDGAA